MQLPIFSAAYFGSIEYYSELIKHSKICLDQFEWFKKQTLRNRCLIAGPNGTQKLIIPYSHFGSEKVSMNNVKINYNENWPRHQIKTLSTAYNSSPFYEFYKDEISAILLRNPEFLLELNMRLTQFILKSLKVTVELKLSETFIDNPSEDFQNLSDIKDNKRISPNFIPKPYHQVYMHKYGFIPNLSILDLLFNQGPNSVNYL